MIIFVLLTVIVIRTYSQSYEYNHDDFVTSHGTLVNCKKWYILPVLVKNDQNSRIGKNENAYFRFWLNTKDLIANGKMTDKCELHGWDAFSKRNFIVEQVTKCNREKTLFMAHAKAYDNPIEKNETVKYYLYYGCEHVCNRKDKKFYMLSVDSEGLCPDGWEKEDMFFDRFIKTIEYNWVDDYTEGTIELQNNHDHSGKMMGYPSVVCESQSVHGGAVETCATDSGTGTFAVRDSHSHYFDFATGSTILAPWETGVKENGLMLPPYYTVIVCSSPRLEFRKDFLVLFQSMDAINEVGSSYRRFHEMDDRLPRGTSGVPGVTGGSLWDHYHLFTGSDTQNAVPSVEVDNTGAKTPMVENHQHNYNGNTSIESILPEVVTHILGLKMDDEDSTEIPKDGIFLTGFTELLPFYDFGIASDEYGFVYGGNSFGEEDGGCHGHSYFGKSDEASTPTGLCGKNGFDFSTTHSHEMDGCRFKYPANVGDPIYPEHVKLLVLKELESLTYIKLTEIIWSGEKEYKGDEAAANKLKEFFEQNWYFLLIGGGAVIFVILAVVMFLLVIRYSKKLKKLTHTVKEFDLILDEEKIIRDDLSHISINTKLFEIKYDDLNLVSQIGKGGSDSVM